MRGTRRRLGLGMGEVEKIEVAGNVAPEGVRCSFVPHPIYQRQLDWQLDGVERYIARVHVN